MSETIRGVSVLIVVLGVMSNAEVLAEATVQTPATGCASSESVQGDLSRDCSVSFAKGAIMVAQASGSSAKQDLNERARRYGEIIKRIIAEKSKIIDRNPCGITYLQVEELAKQVTDYRAEIESANYRSLKSAYGDVRWPLRDHKKRACEISQHGSLADVEVAFWAMSREQKCQSLNPASGNALVESYKNRVGRTDYAAGGTRLRDPALKACVVERVERYLLGANLF